MSNLDLQNIIIDAYQYHFISWLDRINNEYTQKRKQKQNNELINYHADKMKEYEKILQELKNK